MGPQPGIPLSGPNARPPYRAPSTFPDSPIAQFFQGIASYHYIPAHKASARCFLLHRRRAEKLSSGRHRAIGEHRSYDIDNCWPKPTQGNSAMTFAPSPNQFWELPIFGPSRRARWFQITHAKTPQGHLDPWNLKLITTIIQKPHLRQWPKSFWKVVSRRRIEWLTSR